MPIEPITEFKHTFCRVTVKYHPDLERVMTDASGTLALPEAVDWVRDTYNGAPVELQSPQDAWIARLANYLRHPSPFQQYDFQLTRGLVLVWFMRKQPVITIYTGIQHNLALTCAQKGYDSFKKRDDWQVPLDDCREIIALQRGRIRPYPGESVSLQTRREAQRDRLTRDIFGEAMPLIARYLQDLKMRFLHEHFPSTDGIRPKHVRVGLVGVNDVHRSYPHYDVYANVGFDHSGQARGVAEPTVKH